MMRMESGKMPIVYLEPCAVTKGTIKISELPQNLLSPCRRNWAPLIPLALRSPNSAEKPTRSPSSAEKSKLGSVDSSPERAGYKENDSVSGRTEKKSSTSAVAHSSTGSRSMLSQEASAEGFSSRKIKPTAKALSSGIWKPLGGADNCTEDSPVSPICSKSPRLSAKAFSSGIWRPPDGTTDCAEESPVPRTSSRSPRVSEQQSPVGACRRGRPKKLRLSTKPCHSALEAAPSLASSEHLQEREESFRDVSPDLDDVEGVTFVSYASQDALQSHLVEQTPEDPTDPIHQTAVPQESDEEKIERLEEQLIEDLTHLDPRVIMHPSLETAGLKPSCLLSTVSLNLKRLGVVILPTSAAVIRPAWRHILERSPSRQAAQGPLEEEIPFVSRTGKTNDFTKLKGWKQKLGQQSAGVSASKKTEASTSLESSMKNRSAFLSDKLDEYLENEEKIIKQRAALCIGKTSKVVYQMPTKSSSYVRTLDSVLKHQAPQATRGASRSSSRVLFSPQPISVGSVSKATKQSGKVMGSNSASKEQKSASSAKPTSTPASPPAKTSSLRLSSALVRPSGLSKKQIKLMDLENGALWEGKPRTYITEERAEASLITLLTAQGTLSSRKRRVIPKRAPLCKNEFCRLGCICSSLSHVKQPPTHCRKPECMFSCKCPKRKVLVLKTFGRRRKQLNKALREDLIFYDALAEDDEWKPRIKKRKRKKVVEYAIPEPEQPMRSYPLWVRQEGEVDPEPVYTAPHLESCHVSKCSSLSQPQSPFSPKEPGSTEGHTVLSTPASSPKPCEVDEKGPVYWYFESMMTCARVRVFERKDIERPITCTCSSKHCCGREHSLYSNVNNNGTVEACKLKQCSDSSFREVLDSEKLEDFESRSMSPNAAEVYKLKRKEETGSPVQCDSPQKDSAELQSAELQTPTESKNIPKLIEIISDCNWETERANILGVIARHTANKGTSEKICIGNFLVEIMSNYHGKGQDLSPGGVPIYSSLVKITQSSDRERDGKMSAHTVSIQKVSNFPGRKMTETRLIAPKDKLQILSSRMALGKGLTTFHSGLSVASKPKPASATATSASGKSGMIQVSGNAFDETKLTLGQVGALHTVNRLIAALTGRMKSVDQLTKPSSSTAVSSISACFASKHSVSRTRPTGSRVSQDASDATFVKGIQTPPDNYTHLVINKVGALQKTTSCFSSLQPMCSRQQCGTPASTLPAVSTPASTATSPLSTIIITAAAPGSVPVTAGQSPRSVSKIAVTTGASPSAGPSSPSKSSETTDALGTDSSAVPAVKGPSEESAVSTSAVETPAKSTATTLIAVISASASGVRTTPMLTKVLSPSTSTTTTAALTNTVTSTTTTMSVASTPNKTAGIPGQPEAANSAPPDLSKAMKTEGPRLLLIPMQSGTSSVRPVQNLQLTPGQKMILQPLRCPGGNLFRHPNGQIIQLVPLPNSGPGCRPNLHQMVTLAVRNPGSTSGIRFPTPTKACSAAPVPSNSTPPHIVQHGIIPQRGRPRTTPAAKAGTVALKGSSATAPISPVGLAVPTMTTPRPKFITVNTVGQPISASSLVPLQPGGFALLQLPPGQKLLPNTIITTGGPLRFASPPPSVPLAEKAGNEKNSTGEKTANQGSSSTSQEQLIEPGLEEIHVADSELVETTVSEGAPEEDHVSANPLPEVKLGGACDAAPSTPSLSEVDDELEDDSLGQKTALEKPTPAELADHSYTSEKQAVEKSESVSSLQEDAAGTGKERAAEKDTLESDHELVEKEPEDRPTEEEKEWVPDVEMEMEAEVSGGANTSDVSCKGEEDIHKDSGNEELMELDCEDLLEYANTLESDKDTDLQSDMEDGEILSDAEEIDVEKMFDSTSSEEAVDIETVEELSEKINIARLIASASRHHTNKTKCHFHNPYLANKSQEEEPKPKQKPSAHLSKEAKAQLDALVVYRTAHTVNERRRRSEMRDLFERLKRTLGLRREQKASKYYILKQAFGEIQSLQDHSDRLSAERSIQSRKRDLLIRKVSLLTGKTEEVILKKLEYICAKQRALDVQKKNKLLQQGDGTGKQHCSNWKAGLKSSEPMDSLQKVAMNLQNQKPPNVTMLTSGQDLVPEASTGKPLILTRKRSSTTPHSTVSSIPLTAGSFLMTPQGQVLALKGPLVPGQAPIFTTEGLLHGNQVAPKGDGIPGASIAGIASVTIQLQGLPVPLQVNNFTIAGSLSSTGMSSAQSSTRPPGTEAVGSGSADSAQGKEDRSKVAAGSVDNEASSFLMPRIVNVTSLATGEAPSLNVEGESDSFAEVDLQPLDFSMKGRKQRTSQGQQSPTDSERTSSSDLKNSSQITEEFTVPGESEAMPILIVSPEVSESERARQQTQQVVTSHITGADESSGLPKALNLSGLPDGAAMSCTGQAWNQEVGLAGSASITEVILGDKLELQVMSSPVQTCSTGKTIGRSDGDAELSTSQLLEPLLKANGTAAGEMVDTDGYEPFASLLNELAFFNQQFSDDDENPDASSMSDHRALGFIDSGNQEDGMDELSLIHGPIRLVDIDSAEGATDLKQVSERESGGSASPLVLQLEGEDLNVEQLLSGGMPVDCHSDLDDGTLDFESNPTSGTDSSVNVSPPPLVHMKATSPSTTTEVPSALDMLWRPMPKLAPLGLIRVPGKGESPALAESEFEHSPEMNKPMPALARISSPQQASTESPSSVSGEHCNNSSEKEC